jgi:hypothetical protein
METGLLARDIARQSSRIRAFHTPGMSNKARRCWHSRESGRALAAVGDGMALWGGGWLQSHFIPRAEADCLRPRPPAAVLHDDADPLLRDDFEWLTKSIVAFRNGACSSI